MWDVAGETQFGSGRFWKNNIAVVGMDRTKFHKPCRLHIKAILNLKATRLDEADAMRLTRKVASSGALPYPLTPTPK